MENFRLYRLTPEGAVGDFFALSFERFAYGNEVDEAGRQRPCEGGSTLATLGCTPGLSRPVLTEPGSALSLMDAASCRAETPFVWHGSGTPLMRALRMILPPLDDAFDQGTDSFVASSRPFATRILLADRHSVYVLEFYGWSAAGSYADDSWKEDSDAQFALMVARVDRTTTLPTSYNVSVFSGRNPEH
jgi:hypothetical protein